MALKDTSVLFRNLIVKSKLLCYLVLIVLPLLLFHYHVFGSHTWIGNPDRLNSHLKVIKYQAQSLQTGKINAWNEHEMLGYDTFTLPYTFANIYTKITSLFSADQFYIIAGYLSISLLILAGLSAFSFIITIIPESFCALIGAICYQFSALTILKMSQNDMSFAVFILIPLMALVVKKLTINNIASIFLILSLLMFACMHFMFLQKVAYAFIFIGSYCLHLSINKKSKLHIIICSLAFIVALIAAFPRIYGIYINIMQYSRSASDIDLSNFENSYIWHNIFPFEIFRWFDNTLFGRFPSEMTQRNSLNMTEGFLLYTSSIVPFMLIKSAWNHRSKWLGFFKHKNSDIFFMSWFLIFTFSVICCKPIQELIFIIFQRMDFTHARILIVGLLPLCTIIAFVLKEMRQETSTPIIVSVQKNLTLILGAIMMAMVLVYLIEYTVSHASGFTSFPPKLMKEWYDKYEVSYSRLWLQRSAIYRIIISGLLVSTILYCHKRASSISWFKQVSFYLLGITIAAHCFYSCYFQVNGEHVKSINNAFFHSNFHYSPRDHFKSPSSISVKKLHDILENEKYRSILICDPMVAGGFCAGHIPEFWNLRVLDGYYGIGVPSRLASFLGESQIGLRTISFNSPENIPWKILSALNVKYALVVNQDFYRNALDNVDLTLQNLKVIENPYKVLPRAYFVSRVNNAIDFNDAANKIQTVEDSNFENESWAEGLLESSFYPATGNILIEGSGDNLNIKVDIADRDRFLVLNDLYFANWRAFANDKEIKIFPTNLTSRGVIVPAGVSEINFRYTPFVKSHAAHLFYLMGVIIWVAIFVFLKFYFRTNNKKLYVENEKLIHNIPKLI